MNNYFVVIIYGLVQGLTEFLPISSSGHLVLLHRWLTLTVVSELTFDVWLHVATLSAVVCFFRTDLWRLAKGMISYLRGRRSSDGRLGLIILFASLPAALAGLLFDDLIETFFRSPLIVALMLVLVGILFMIIERISRQNLDLPDIGLRRALFVGLAQALALIPGTSRSGITIIAGMLRNLRRSAAVKFSFLLSVPVIAGASFIKVPELLVVDLRLREIGILSVGFVATFIASLLAIKILLKITSSYRLDIFAYYRFLLALAIVILYFWR